MALWRYATPWFLVATSRNSHLGRLLIASSLLGLCGDISMSLPWDGAQMTAPNRQDAYQASSSPRPTIAPNVLLKRSNLDSNTCGFIDGNISKPLTCLDPLKTCVTDEGLRAFGCCSTATTGPSLGSFIECGFRTACVDNLDAFANTTRLANTLAQACFSSTPFCQTLKLYFNTDEGGIFTDFQCGNFPLTRILERSALASTSSSATAAATSTASSSTPAVAKSAGLSASSKIGIIVGSILGGLVVVVVANIYLPWWRRRRFKKTLRVTEWNIRPDDRFSGNSKSNIKLNPTKLDPISGSQLRNWKAFLSMYGEEGIVLRELIMLVSALYFPVADFCRPQHWSYDGERDAASPPGSDDFFLIILKEASSEDDLVILEKILHTHGVLLVRDTNDLHIDQGWNTDGRSWCALSSNTESNVDYADFFRDLLAIYSQMPHRDVHPIAERYRELFYNHAHVAIMVIFQKAQEAQLDIATEALFCHVGLQVLSHRYQVEDIKLIEYLQRRVKLTLPESRHLGDVQYQNIHQDMGACVTLHLAELRMIIEQYERSEGQWHAAQPLLHDAERFLSKAVHARNLSDHRAKGMIGYALVELMNATEVLQERDTFERITRVTKIWRDKAMESRSAIEMAALCCVLVRLRAFDEMYRLPEEHYLSCGYYLARAGYLIVAEIFISMGIQYYERWHPQVPMWRYHLELCGVKMRLGHWEETARLLSSNWKCFDTIENDAFGSSFEKRRSGEFGEYRLNLASLLTDCYIATNRVSDALRTISEALLPVASMRDSFIRSIRVALKVRKLGLQLQLKDMYHAPTTAVDLCRDLQDPAPLAAGIQTLFWTVQEILACVDRLVHAEHLQEAYLVLQQLTGWTTGQVPDGFLDQRARNLTASLPDDLKNYASQRWSEISSMIELRRSKNPRDSSNLPSTSLDIVPTSIDPTMTSVKSSQVPLTTLPPHAQVPAVSPKSSRPQRNVENYLAGFRDLTNTPQEVPMQSIRSLTVRDTVQSTLPAAELRPVQPRIQQVPRAGAGEISQRRKKLRNLMKLAKLRKPPQTDPSGSIVEPRHEPELSVHELGDDPIQPNTGILSA